MIIVVCGGIGSGKSVTATKFIVESGQKIFGNYRLFSIKDYHRLKFSDIITTEDKKQRINWEFWKKEADKKEGFHICLDEIHNILNSRRSQTKNNILLSVFFAQIRKLLGSSEKHHLICISQEVDRIDVSIRDLTHKIVYCKKVIDYNHKIMTKVRENGRIKKKLLPKVYVFQYTFVGHGCMKRYDNFKELGVKSWNGVPRYYLANPYFQFYDSYEFIEFGNEEFL